MALYYTDKDGNLIKIAGSSNDSQTINELQNQIAQLNLKIDKLQNGMLVPTGKYLELDIPTNDTDITAPDNGWFSIRMTAADNNNHHRLSFTNKTNNMYSRSDTYFIGSFVTNIIPVKKGDIVNVQYYEMKVTNDRYFRFYYGGVANE